MSTAEQFIDEFDERGFVIVRNLLEIEVVAGAVAELEAWVERRAHQWHAEGLIEDVCDNEPFGRRLACLHQQFADASLASGTLRRELHWPGMFGLFFHPGVLDLAALILGPEVRLYPNYSIRPKLPQHEPSKVLWHQDAGYTQSGLHGSDANAGELRADQLRMVNVWSPLVPARVANGCMKFVPGSHKLGLVAHERREYYLEIARQDLDPHLGAAVDIECDPGDVVLFSNMIFHMGQDNNTNEVRWSADWRYQDATQSTLRSERGHLARSLAHPDEIVRSAAQWAQLSFV